MKLIKICVFVGVLVSLGGCVNTRISDAEVRGLGRVGVVSLLGDTFHGIYIGTTVFNNSGYDADVADWQIDPDTAEYVQAKLEKDGIRAEILQTQPAQREIFYRGGRNAEPDYGAICQAASEQNYATVVVIARSRSEDEPEFKPGYGLQMRSLLGLSRRYPYAEFVIRVFDVKTEKQLAVGIGPPIEMNSSNALHWKSHFDEYSPQEKLAIKAGIEDHIRHQIDRELDKMNLTSATRGA